MQTTLPPYANNLREGWSKIVTNEGYAGLYKGLYPLWARQIPYTMVKFATFESAVAQIYKFSGKPKESYSTLGQTGVSFLGGYIAGIGCAVVSHPADVMVSKLNSDRKAGEGAMQAVSRIYGKIGFAGLWNGLPVRIAMIGTLTAFQWLIYDSFKVYLGVSLDYRLQVAGFVLMRRIAADHGRSLSPSTSEPKGYDNLQQIDGVTTGRFMYSQEFTVCPQDVEWRMNNEGAQHRLHSTANPRASSSRDSNTKCIRCTRRARSPPNAKKAWPSPQEMPVQRKDCTTLPCRSTTFRARNAFIDQVQHASSALPTLHGCNDHDGSFAASNVRRACASRVLIKHVCRRLSCLSDLMLNAWVVPHLTLPSPTLSVPHRPHSHSYPCRHTHPS